MYCAHGTYTSFKIHNKVPRTQLYLQSAAKVVTCFFSAIWFLVNDMLFESLKKWKVFWQRLVTSKTTTQRIHHSDFQMWLVQYASSFNPVGTKFFLFFTMYFRHGFAVKSFILALRCTLFCVTVGPFKSSASGDPIYFIRISTLCITPDFILTFTFAK